MPVHGCDGCYGIARKAYGIIEQVAFIFGIAAAPNYVAILVRQHGLYAGQRQRF